MQLLGAMVAGLVGLAGECLSILCDILDVCDSFRRVSWTVFGLKPRAVLRCGFSSVLVCAMRYGVWSNSQCCAWYLNSAPVFSVFIVVLESGRIGSTLAGIVMVYSLSFCEAITFLARAHADVRLCALIVHYCGGGWLQLSL
jgi:hypothetical protein